MLPAPRTASESVAMVSGLASVAASVFASMARLGEVTA